MRGTLAIAGKETRVYFSTWLSYAVIALFLVITAYFFQALVRQFQFMVAQYMQMQAPQMTEQMNLTDMVMTPLLANTSVFFLFFVPIITMRLFAEERSKRTLELLLTSPVRPIEIVLGKYLAALLLLAVMLGATLVFPVVLQAFGNSAGETVLDWKSIWTGYLGLFLMGAAAVAIGLFASSLTDSMVIAAVLSFVALIVLYVIGFSAQGQTGFWKAFYEHVAISGHLEGFVRGIIRTPSLVYYTSLAVLGIFCTYLVVEAQRWR
jgi:ABC-2 type transport system permease protein